MQKRDWKPKGKEEWQVFLFSIGGGLLSVFLLIAAFTQFVTALIMVSLYQDVYEASKFIIGAGLTLFISLSVVQYTRYELNRWTDEYTSRPSKNRNEK